MQAGWGQTPAAPGDQTPAHNKLPLSCTQSQYPAPSIITLHHSTICIKSKWRYIRQGEVPSQNLWRAIGHGKILSQNLQNDYSLRPATTTTELAERAQAQTYHTTMHKGPSTWRDNTNTKYTEQAESHYRAFIHH